MTPTDTLVNEAVVQEQTETVNSTANGEALTITEKVTETESLPPCPELDFRYEEKPIYSIVKRAADIVLSLFALLVLSPLLIIVSLIIICVDFGNPFFAQDRVGKNGRIFRMYKFRSMYKDAEERKAELMQENECDGTLFKIENDPRILGGIGRFIRKYSVDELVQLVNILKGDMSIIGPRPFVLQEQEKLPKERLLVRPGLSCYWQVNGKNKLNDEWAEYYDKKYIMDRSVVTDIKLILKTFLVIFKSDNS